MDPAQERALLNQKRQKWMAERNLESQMTEFGINPSDTNSEILTEITQKMQEKFQQKLKEHQNQPKNMQINAENKLNQEIESNTCPICYELMVPPNHSPILLFPCGHTFCKLCTSKCNQISQCPYCRKKITSSAVNISLQNLICVFTNNKHLLQNQQQEQKEVQNDEELNDFQQNYQFLQMRYDILTGEKKKLQNSMKRNHDDLQSIKKVNEHLIQESLIVDEKISKLEKELSLIDEFIENQKIDYLKKQDLVQKDKERIELVENSIQAISQDLQKYKILAKESKNK